MNRTAIAVSALSIVLASGTTIAADTPQRAHSGQEMNTKAQLLTFKRASVLLGSEVNTQAGEAVGTVSELVVERGDGTVRYVILSVGGVLGIGDSEYAVPYSAFSHDLTTDTLTIDTDGIDFDRPDELERRYGWLAFGSDSWSDVLNSPARDVRDGVSSVYQDPYIDSIRNAGEKSFVGVIVDVDRRPLSTGIEQVRATVDTAERGQRTVVLGPTWFLSKHDAVPMLGDEVSVRAFSYDKDGDEYLIAREIDHRGETIKLRKESGDATWSVRRDSSGAVPVGTGRFVGISEVIGMEAMTRGAEQAGEIDDVIVELGTGRVVLLGYDPNENFLGIGDTELSVPWNAVSVGEEFVRIDADFDVLRECERMPDSVAEYEDRARLTPVFEVFGVAVYEFDLDVQDEEANSAARRGS